MSKTGIVQGVQVALVTPFGRDALSPPDLEQLERHCASLISSGVSGLVPSGTTGESPTLTDQEWTDVVRIVVNVAKGTDVRVIVGTGTNSTLKTVALTDKAAKLGADMALVVAPYYNKPSSADLVLHYKEIDKVGLPLVPYNIPGRTGVNIDPDTFKSIAHSCQTVVALKASNGNLDEMTEILACLSEFTRPIGLLSGDDSLALPILAIGGTGLVSVAANLIPGTVCRLVALAAAGQYGEAQKINLAIHRFSRRLLTLGPNPEPIKSLMANLGMLKGGCRLPLSQISSEAVLSLRAELSSIRAKLGKELTPDAAFDLA